MVTANEAGIPPMDSTPAFDRLFRQRELNQATATTGDVLETKTYYGNRGELLTGTIPVISVGKAFVFNPNTSVVEVDYAGAYYKEGINVSINTNNIDPSTIKQGSSIFGVTGTYTPALKNQTFTTNGKYSAADEGVVGYSTVEVNVPVGPTSITDNGTYSASLSGYVGYDTVNVNIPMDGALTVIPNKSGSVYTYSNHGDGTHKA
jgi:hypothetical protein